MNNQIIKAKLESILFDLKVMANSSIEYKFTDEEIGEIIKIRTFLKNINNKIQ